MKLNCAIRSIGVYLPPTNVTNDRWSPETVARWGQRHGVLSAQRVNEGAFPMTPNMTRVLHAVKSLKDDPFRGSRERRVMDDAQRPSEMEALAARDALARAGLAPRDIDMLLVTSTLPDYLTPPNAGVLHAQIGLRPGCFSLSVDATCNSFLMQMALARSMMASGAAKNALLVQSSGVRRKVRPEDEFAPWWGDGATAVVLSSTSGPEGIRGEAHATDGSFHEALVTGCPGRSWWDASASELHVYGHDVGQARRMQLSTCDFAAVVVSEALRRAECTPEQVVFHAAHQPAPWLAELTREACGLVNAKTVETFSRYANLGPANIPLVLRTASDANLLHDGAIVSLFSLGAGCQYSAMVVRWG